MSEMAPAVAAYFDALNKIDREEYVACFTQDAILRDPYGGPLREGETGLHEFFDTMEQTWSKFEMEPQGAYKSGDRVAVPWTARATAHSGKTADFAGVNLFTLGEEGRIKELQGYWNFKEMLAQIR